MTEQNLSLKLQNVRTPSGGYRLHRINALGQTEPILVIGVGGKPYDIIHVFPNSNWIVVRKYGCRAQDNGKVRTTVVLLNIKTGAMAERLSSHGVFRVRYDSATGFIYFDPYQFNGRKSSKTWCIDGSRIFPVMTVPSMVYDIDISEDAKPVMELECTKDDRLPPICNRRTTRSSQKKEPIPLEEAWRIPGRLAKMTKVSLRNLCKRLTQLGQDIPPEVEAVVIDRFPGYDPETQTFNKSKGGFKSLKSNPAPRPTRHISPNKDGVFRVTQKLKKTAKEGDYYDVFVNGTRLISNHINTRLETFLDGQILAIHGTVTDMPNLPSVPLWQVFDTELKAKRFAQIDPTTQKNFYIKDIHPTASKTLHLDISNNKMKVILNQRADVMYRFVIDRENQGR